MDASMWTLEVSRTDPADCEIRHEACPTVQSGELLVEIEHLAMTANTMTYAAMGDTLGYWSLFPAAVPGHGRVPAWGHARVLTSRVEAVAAGGRLFGLWPMASHVMLTGRRSRLGLRETSLHRQQVNPVYNQYALAPPTSSEACELRAMFHPLFVTSLVLAQHLAEHEHYGAREIVFVSASSKTALGTAFMLNGARRLIGLTSRRNADWVAQVGLYDAVVAYDALNGLAGAERCLVVDFSGEQPLLDRVNATLGGRCVGLIRVGATHGGAVGPGVGAPSGSDGAGFSGPQQIEGYVGQWGPAEFGRRLDHGIAAFTAAVRPSYRLQRRHGADGMLEAYRELQQGRVAASTLLLAHPVG